MVTTPPAKPIFDHPEPCTRMRWGERIDVDLPVVLHPEGAAPVPARLRNISISGALIATEAAIPPGTVLTIVASLPNGDRSQEMEFAACVNRNSEDSVSVEWRDMACQPLVDLLQAMKRPEAQPKSPKP